MKNWIVALLIMTTAQLSSAGEEFPKEVPTPKDRPSILFQILNSLALHVEKQLQDSGFHPEVCSFKNYRTQKTHTFKGVGPCLYENFMEGLRSQGDVGVTFVWLKTGDELRPVRIDWRPSEEGWKKVLKEFLQLEFEGIYWKKNESKEIPLSYKQNAIGRVRLTIPEGQKLSEYLPEKPNAVLLPWTDATSAVELELNPIYRKDGLNYYHGQIRIQNDTNLFKEGESVVLDFKTDINIYRTSRLFQAEGKVGP